MLLYYHRKYQLYLSTASASTKHYASYVSSRMIKGLGDHPAARQRDHQRRHAGATPTCMLQGNRCSGLMTTPLYVSPVRSPWGISVHPPTRLVLLQRA